MNEERRGEPVEASDESAARTKARWIIGALLCYAIVMHSYFFVERATLWHGWERQFKVAIAEAHRHTEHLMELIAAFDAYQADVQQQRDMEAAIQAAAVRALLAGPPPCAPSSALSSDAP